MIQHRDTGGGVLSFFSFAIASSSSRDLGVATHLEIQEGGN